MKFLAIITVFASLSLANECRVVFVSKDASEVILTCPAWQAGLTRAYRAPTAQEWAAVNGWKDSVPDTTRGTK